MRIVGSPDITKQTLDVTCVVIFDRRLYSNYLVFGNPSDIFARMINIRTSVLP